MRVLIVGALLATPWSDFRNGLNTVSRGSHKRLRACRKGDNYEWHLFKLRSPGIHFPGFIYHFPIDQPTSMYGPEKYAVEYSYDDIGRVVKKVIRENQMEDSSPTSPDFINNPYFSYPNAPFPVPLVSRNNHAHQPPRQRQHFSRQHPT